MLDPNLIRNNLEKIIEKLALREFKLDFDKLKSLEDRRKILQIQTTKLQTEHKIKSKYIGQIKESGKNINLLRLEVNELRKKLDKIKYELEKLKLEIRDIILTIPNLPDESVPIGKDNNDNIEIKRWKTPRKFDFEIKDHVVLGENLNGLDFTSAAKLTGSRFVVMRGKIANLYRALSQFMLDLHIREHGYSEIYVPYIVNQESLYCTGQLPKFKEDLFYLSPLNSIIGNNKYALIPTAEVPLINLVRNAILNEDNLPIKLTACSSCFRSEAGSYGRDTRGLIRMHQFDKVEMIQIVHPEKSMNSLEELTNHAEKVLELLDLPYRRISVCTGDIGFNSCKTYDLEVWIPSQNMYREVSSCSNVGDFQARRMKTRYRSKFNKKLHLVHTLNGSGLAIGRTLVAILENYQQSDGSIKIPEVLYPYMENQRYIS